ncbi:uncharacterized protein PHACADRAFT_121298 [Phanerochaete carnosa HHB-10118-sp]|uniref:SRP54-type proteins GTP-binding domain-containing protein n=1 Tax=Phanerochaete carnosa (strain HHB-10118-sp) TaxID=650164 RepID=K5W9G5_PHACS|nr:uncharacterized protein PHACADRAFT_121298 [Phanerochaete carnosa HHB-10118-sp]EKM55619.1 hypothetical protein PHACADRAFT_121298 [Phanerochaete carnosa HHB-10118-sp]
MLDHCSISHKGGVILWSRSFTPAASQSAASSASPVSSLIRDALIEGRSAESQFEKDGYALKWTFVNDLELIFVVAYQRILQLTYVDDLLAALKTLFVKVFQPFLATFVASLHAASSSTTLLGASGSGSETAFAWDFTSTFEKWDTVFDNLLKTFETKAAQERKSRLKHIDPAVHTPVESTPPSDDQSTFPSQSNPTTVDEEQIARNVQALKNRLKPKGPGGAAGRKGRRGVGGAGSGLESVPGSDSDTPSKAKKSKTKARRKWGDEAPSESDMASLDFSYIQVDSPSTKQTTMSLSALVDQASMGTRTNEGMYEVKDWDFDVPPTRNVAAATAVEKPGTSLGALGSLFSRITGSKTLTQADLAPVLEGMKQHLMKKNVAKEIAEKVVESVGEDLIGRRITGWGGTNTAVRNALSTALTRILTPKTSTDLLLSIRTKLSESQSSMVGGQTGKKEPYSIVFVGVNGVGKSTNLSKVCFWLVQNGMRVLIAACDTFRSGAVEQLRVHVRNLSMLGVNGATDSKGRVELYEKGYGKDAAGIAKESISYAKDHDFDVVLIDTAGRMQDNEPLMRALAKLVSTNSPDKIIFVGEALVGNEAVDQLTKFDRALRDFSAASGYGGGSAKERGIDGMIVTKWDTVDDKVGAALSMTYVTGQPIIFVGCGQTYTDLRQLRVSNVVQAILDD